MYVPEPFAAPGPEAAMALIREYPFGLLIATLDGRPEAAHLPFHLATDEGPRGTLYCHVARANPIGRAAAASDRVLCVFSGPHAYVSPDWYATENLVPTWNYAAVHVYGAARLLDDRAVARLLERLSVQEEAAIPGKAPWTPATMAEGFYPKMRRAVTGLAIEIAEVQGKWKMSQNRDPADVRGAAAALRALGDEARIATAAVMAASLGEGEPREP